MNTRRLIVDFDKCTGCRICMIECAIEKTGRMQPSKARLFVVKHDQDSLDIPIVCHQCEICTKVCPEEAIQTAEFGAKVVISEDCIACGACEDACPFGTIWIDKDLDIAVKCDLCRGEPRCVQTCPYDALSLKTSDEVILDKRINESIRIAKRLRESIPYTH